jgi:hypothetical protein
VRVPEEHITSLTGAFFGLKPGTLSSNLHSRKLMIRERAAGALVQSKQKRKAKAVRINAAKGRQAPAIHTFKAPRPVPGRKITDSINIFDS